MKIGNFSLVVLSSAFALHAYADKVKLEQIPAHIQEQIRAQVGSAPIEDIDRETRNGKTFYEVAFKKNGEHTELKLEDTGKPTSPSGGSTIDSRKITYDELPAAVKRAVKTRSRGAELNDIDRQVKNGRTTYEVGLRLPSGRQRELLISDDGSILEDSSSLTANLPATSADAIPSQSSRSMKYEDLPANVRRVAEAKLRSGNVNDVQRHVEGGRINYEVGFQKENGQRQELVISEDGQVIRNEIFSGSGIGSPGSTQSGSSGLGSSQASPYATINSPVPLRNAREIDRRQLPVIVDRTVQQHVKNNIEELLRGQWRGNPVYQIGFTDENNSYVELQVDDNGRIIYDPRASAKTDPNAATTPKGNFLNELGRALFEKN